MMRKILSVTVFILLAGYGYTQQAGQPDSSRTAKKGSHQVKTVNSKMIRMESTLSPNKQPLPPMKTRQDTLRYLIQQHIQQKSNSR